MIDALVCGRLVAEPKTGTSKNGKPFVTCRVLVPGDDRLSVSVIAFSTTVCAALQELATGDSVALAGELTPRLWTDKEGQARIGADLTAHAALTPYHVTRRRKAMQSERDGAEYRRHPGEL